LHEEPIPVVFDVGPGQGRMGWSPRRLRLKRVDPPERRAWSRPLRAGRGREEAL